jgi:hypothetical protein
MAYIGRKPDHADAQIRDNMAVFIEEGKPMVRGQIRANYPQGYGYRDLDITADQAEQIGLALIHAAVKARANADAVNYAAARKRLDHESLESNVKFYAGLGYSIENIARALDVTLSSVENTQAWTEAWAKRLAEQESAA